MTSGLRELDAAVASTKVAGGNAAIEEACSEWRKVLGARHVITDPEELGSAERSTFSTGRRIPVILRPGSTEEVQECLRIANQYRVPVYPVSSGRNWGYGSRVPAADSCALMELMRMN